VQSSHRVCDSEALQWLWTILRVVCYREKYIRLHYVVVTFSFMTALVPFRAVSIPSTFPSAAHLCSWLTYWSTEEPFSEFIFPFCQHSKHPRFNTQTIQNANCKVTWIKSLPLVPMLRDQLDQNLSPVISVLSLLHSSDVPKILHHRCSWILWFYIQFQCTTWVSSSWNYLRRNWRIVVVSDNNTISPK